MKPHDYFVIDAHCHIGDPGIQDRIGAAGSASPSVREVFESFEALQRHVGWTGGTAALGGSPGSYPALMKESGTDFAVFAMLSFAEELGGVDLCPNEFLEKLLADSQGAPYAAFAGVDPRLEDGVKRDLVRSLVRDRGFLGIKLNPNDWGGFSLGDARLMPILETCSELGAPVHVHTGYDPTGCIANGNPMLLEPAMIALPSLTIMLEHYGFPWKYQAYALCRKYPRVYLTLALHFNALVHHNKALAWQELEEMRIHAGIGKIVYGSDFPASPNQAEVIRFLEKEKVPRGLRAIGYPEWTHEMRARVLGLNAAEALGISHPRIDALEARFRKPAAPEGPTMRWEPEALKTLESIPSFIRKSVILHVERYAKERKLERVSAETLAAARAAR